MPHLTQKVSANANLTIMPTTLAEVLFYILWP